MGEWVLGPPMGRNSPWAPGWPLDLAGFLSVEERCPGHGVGGVQTQGTGSYPSQAVIFMRGQPLRYP